ncbi:MAG: response regulator [Candidatus Omnitrophica bacterium]|nr:response regulator [Candidatus Omnitrophota bacterium]
MKILIVDDDEADIELMKELLAEAKFSDKIIEEASTSKDALAKLAQGSIQVILLDLGLPDSSGLETLKKIRDEYPQIPVIIVSTLEDERLANEAVRMGAHEYLIKGQIDATFLLGVLTAANVQRKVLKEIKSGKEEIEKIRLEIRERKINIDQNDIF